MAKTKTENYLTLNLSKEYTYSGNGNEKVHNLRRGLGYHSTDYLDLTRFEQNKHTTYTQENDDKNDMTTITDSWNRVHCGNMRLFDLIRKTQVTNF